MTALTYDKWIGPRNYEVCTISIAAPGVITKTGHGLLWKDQVTFVTTGALPTGISADTWYYVIPIDLDTFQISATSTGTAITTTGSQSGVHSCGTDKPPVMTMNIPNYL